MAIISGEGLGRELCDIWGLDKNQIQGITIGANEGDAAYVDVRMLLTVDNAESLKKLLTRYKLCESEKIQ